MINKAEDAQLIGRSAIHLRVPDVTVGQHSVGCLRLEHVTFGEPRATKKLDARLLGTCIVRTSLNYQPRCEIIRNG
jgi:hypothetical protein